MKDFSDMEVMLVSVATNQAIYCREGEMSPFAVFNQNPELPDQWWKIVAVSGQKDKYQLISLATGQAIYCRSPSKGGAPFAVYDSLPNAHDQWWWILTYLNSGE